MFDLSDDDAERVDVLIRGASSVRGAILAVSRHLNVDPAQVAEYVTVFRTGRFDVTPEDRDSDDEFAGVRDQSGLVAVRDHGELGPVLGDPDHDFTEL